MRDIGKITASIALLMISTAPAAATPVKAVPAMMTGSGDAVLTPAAIKAISAKMRAVKRLHRKNNQAGAGGGAAGGAGGGAAGGAAAGATAGAAAGGSLGVIGAVAGVAAAAGGVAAASSGGGSNSP